MLSGRGSRGRILLGLLVLVPANSFAQELGRGGEVKLFLDAGAKGLDGLHADVKVFGNLAGFVTLAEQLKDFEFPVAELSHGRTERRGVSIQEPFCEQGREP